MIGTLKNLFGRISRFYYKVTKREPWYKYYGNNNKINYPKLTVYQLIEKTAKTYPSYYAYEYYGKKVTYREFIDKIKRTASALTELGVKEGDRVIYSKYAGTNVKLGDDEFIVVKQSDIVAIVED